MFEAAGTQTPTRQNGFCLFNIIVRSVRIYVCVVLLCLFVCLKPQMFSLRGFCFAAQWPPFSQIMWEFKQKANTRSQRKCIDI